MQDDRLAFAWAILLTRGLRRGELCGIKWSDIDLEGSTLRVARARVVVDAKVTDSMPKTKAGQRTIPLDPHLVALLRVHKARQATEQLAAGPAYEGGGWLVPDELGRPYHPDTISDWFLQPRAPGDGRGGWGGDVGGTARGCRQYPLTNR